MTDFRITQMGCIEWLWKCIEHGIRVDMLFADPPFNIGVEYDQFSDRMTPDEYFQFSADWIRGAAQIIKPGGALLIHASPFVHHSFLIEAMQINGIDGWYEREIVWNFGFGQHTDANWPETHCRCIVLRRPGQPRKWHPDEVLVKSLRLKIGDRRVLKSKRKGWVVPGTVWGTANDGEFWGRVQGNDSERRPLHRNQLRELYLARIIRAYTAPGELVCDPFVGSGTTPTVAVGLGRNFIGCEQSAAYCESAISRVIAGPVRDVAAACGPTEGEADE